MYLDGMKNPVRSEPKVAEPGGPSRRGHNFGPSAVFLIGMVATGLLTGQLWRMQSSRDRLLFDYEVERTRDAIEDRLATYMSVLDATAGMLEINPDITPDNFRTFVHSLDLMKRFPGIQGIGYARRLLPGEVAQFEQRMHSQGFPQYRVWPVGPRAEYFPIATLEPRDDRNLSAMGYDMHTEPVRRAAMEDAVHGGEATASGPVRLVQEVDAARQAGFLLYVPVFREGLSTATERQRRDALIGFAYAPFRANDLLHGIFGKTPRRLDFTVFDQSLTSASRLFSTLQPGEAESVADPKFDRTIDLEVAGRHWMVQLWSNPGFQTTTSYDNLYWAALGGLLITFLMYQLILQQARGRSLAEAQAQRIRLSEASLLESQNRLRVLNESLEKRVRERTALAEERADQLHRLAADLTQAEQSERRRLAQVLHDHLQQYLYATKLRLERVIKYGDHDSAQRENLEHVDEMLSEMLRITRTLTIDLRPPVLADRGLGAALKWLARQMLRDYGLRVELSLDEEIHLNSEDLSLFLLQATREILFNVVKHAQVDQARLEMRREESDAVITINDRGRGFDPTSVCESVNSGSGPGIGLFNLHQRLNLLGGELAIDSRPGGGTQVMLRAPLHAVSNVDPIQGMLKQTQSATLDDTHTMRQRLRIMLVDDHSIVREGLANLLTEEPDLELVGEAADGVQAIEMARQLNPDVIIMDISMPRLNGIEATRRIKHNQPFIRIIGLSMHEQADMALAMSEAGAEGYISKDAPSSMLLQAIRDATQAV